MTGRPVTDDPADAGGECGFKASRPWAVLPEGIRTEGIRTEGM